ncbi:DNRLRE domain-containing protein [Streptomyces sp. enrichment culture]|uniref:DNRLRE domain-containing protein n=1 Tax=Streptomyces sp. enrichment culture TaxID=1795815 RepID=UPI003F54DF9C
MSLYEQPHRRRGRKKALTALTVSAALFLVAQSTAMGADGAAQARNSKLATIDAGELATALDAARHTGRPVALASQTTEASQTFVRPDGSFTTELTAGPARVKSGGTWRSVDVALTRTSEGTVISRVHPVGLQLSGGGGTPVPSLRAAQEVAPRDLVTLGEGDDAVTLQWKGGLPAPELNGTTARYRSAVPGADVIVEATRTGFEQYVEITSKPAADDYTYTLPVKAKGLKAKANRDGSVTFTDARTGNVRASMPAPVMWDATTDRRSGEHTHRAPVDMTVVDKGDGILDLVVTPDARFLADPATRYPVTVDPSTSALSDAFDTYVQQGESADWSADTELDFGNPGTKNPDGTPRTARSFISWNTTPIQDALITKATLSLFNFHSGNTDCTDQAWTVWDTGAASTASRWTNQPAWNQQIHSSTQTAGSPECAGQPDGWIDADVGTLVQTWASAKATHGNMGLRAATDDVRAWKRVNSANAASNPPKLTVDYNFRPGNGHDMKAGPPYVKNASDVWVVDTTRAFLRVTFDDADGDTVNGTFDIRDAVTGKPVGYVLVSGWVAAGKPLSVRVPAGWLANGGTYEFRASAYDGTHYDLSWTPWTKFTVDTSTAPGDPTPHPTSTGGPS